MATLLLTSSDERRFGSSPQDLTAESCSSQGLAERAAAMLRQELPTHRIRRGGTEIAVFATRGEDPPLVVAELSGNVIVLNGWCFDPDGMDVSELARSLIHKDLEKARSRLRRLDGQFCGVVVGPDGTSFTLQEGLALLPLYGTASDGAAFVSNCPLTLATLTNASIDRQSLLALVIGSTIRAPRSLYEAVVRLGAGEEWRIGERHVLEPTTAHSFLDIQTEKLSFDDSIDSTIELLRQSARAVVDRYPRVLADLTGGLDSRLVCALLAEHVTNLDVTVSGDPSDADVTISRAVARAVGWNWRHTQIPDSWAAERFAMLDESLGGTSGATNAIGADRVLWIKHHTRSGFDASVGGSGGEFLRDLFWTPEYFRFPPRKTVDLEYFFSTSMFRNPKIPHEILPKSSLTAYLESQRSDLRAAIPNPALQRKMAAIDVASQWRMSGMGPTIFSAVWPTFPSPAPLETRSIFEHALARPVTHRGGGRLARAILERLNPALAELPTWYGTSARRFSLRRPRDLVGYGVHLGERGAARLRRAVPLASKLFGSPVASVSIHAATADPRFRDLLREHGYLDPEAMRVSMFFEKDEFRTFIAGADIPTSAYRSLDAVISLEHLLRTRERISSAPT